MLDCFDATYIIATAARYKEFVPNLGKKLLSLGAKNIKKCLVGAQSLDYEMFWIDVKPPKMWGGREQSFNFWCVYWKILEDAKEKKYDSILVCEDDLDIRPNFEEVFPKAIKELPADWDMLYCGANFHSETQYLISDHIIKCNKCLDLHMLAINHTMYDTILAFKYDNRIKQNPLCYLDGGLAHLTHHEKNVYAVWPQVAWQFDAYSTNENRFMSRTKNWQGCEHLVDLRKNKE